MFIKLMRVWLFANLFFMSIFSFAVSQKTYLVKDGQWQADMPARFRSTNHLPNVLTLNLKGLDTLRMAGSAQFTQHNLARVIKRLPSEKIMVVDLRKESHGFLNGYPVSWYSARNAENIKKTPEEVDKTRAHLLAELAKQPSITVYSELSKSLDGEIDPAKHEKIDVHDVQDEQTIVENAGLAYKRFYVTDHDQPDDQTVNDFLQFYKTLPKKTWLYFHCRGGSGRTTTFMAMVDMMHNAKTLSFDDILTRQAVIGGQDLRHLPSKNHYNHKYAVARLAFLKKFYEYAKVNGVQLDKSWR